MLPTSVEVVGGDISLIDGVTFYRFSLTLTCAGAAAAVVEHALLAHDVHVEATEKYDDPDTPSCSSPPRDADGASTSASASSCNEEVEGSRPLARALGAPGAPATHTLPLMARYEEVHALTKALSHAAPGGGLPGLCTDLSPRPLGLSLKSMRQTMRRWASSMQSSFGRSAAPVPVIVSDSECVARLAALLQTLFLCLLTHPADVPGFVWAWLGACSHLARWHAAMAAGKLVQPPQAAGRFSNHASCLAFHGIAELGDIHAARRQTPPSVEHLQHSYEPLQRLHGRVAVLRAAATAHLRSVATQLQPVAPVKETRFGPVPQRQSAPAAPLGAKTAADAARPAGLRPTQSLNPRSARLGDAGARGIRPMDLRPSQSLDTRSGRGSEGDFSIKAYQRVSAEGSEEFIMSRALRADALRAVTHVASVVYTCLALEGALDALGYVLGQQFAERQRECIAIGMMRRLASGAARVESAHAAEFAKAATILEGATSQLARWTAAERDCLDNLAKALVAFPQMLDAQLAAAVDAVELLATTHGPSLAAASQVAAVASALRDARLNAGVDLGAALLAARAAVRDGRCRLEELKVAAEGGLGRGDCGAGGQHVFVADAVLAEFRRAALQPCARSWLRA